MQVPPNLLSNLNQFTSKVWGNPQALKKQLGSQDVKYIDLGEHFEAFSRLSLDVLGHEKILIRREYDDVLQALQTEQYTRGVYITGQPGIGKSCFLIYALIHFLGERKPVALHHLSGHPYYVLFKDNATPRHIHDSAPLDECDFVWALSDSNAYMQIPPAIFLGRTSRILVIQTTSPKDSRYKEWSKEHRASCYIMDIWTETEVENLAMLLDLDVERMTTLAKKWGAVPRLLLNYLGEEDEETRYWYRSLAGKAIEKCRDIMDGTLQPNLSHDGPSPFYFIRPLKTATGVVKRKFPSITVPTQTLREILGEALRSQDNQEKLRFYRTFSNCPETRQAAGYIFESWVHSFIIAEEEMECQWVAQRSVGRSVAVQLPTIIRGTKNLFTTTLTAFKLTTKRPPYYWLPPHTNFPGVDSILVLENNIFVFQITISASHRSPIDGLNTLKKHLPSNLKKAQWRMVFVGAEKDSIKKVAEYWADELPFPSERVRIPIAWSELDPVKVNIAYKAYRDEEMVGVNPE